VTSIRIAERTTTVVWEGEVIVLGAGLAGIGAALACAEGGKSVCLLEEGPTLGREISREWVPAVPEGALRAKLDDLCVSRGVPEEGPVDIFTATLALDRIVEEAGVTPLVRVVPTRPVRDEDGRLAGVEVVGKSGRQLVRAPVVIDATPGRRFSRAVLDLPQPGVRRAERRLYVHGVDTEEAPEEIDVPEELGVDDDRAHVLPAAWPGEVLVSFQISCDAPAKIDRVEQKTLSVATGVMEYLRRNTEQFSGASLVDVSPDVRATCEPEGFDAGELSGTGLVVPAPAGSVADRMEAAERLVDSLVAEDERVPLPEESIENGRQRLPTDELRADEAWDLPQAHLPQAPATMHEPTDVVVVGWGTGGAMAALTAAREGASVTVVDPCPMPGGIATAGRIHSYYHGKTGGTQDQIDELVQGRQATLGGQVHGFHPVAKADVLQEEIIESGVSTHSGHVAFGVVKEEGRVMGVVTAAADGYHAFPCRVVIDGTGDGDVAAAAGARLRLGWVGDGFPQPYSYTPSRVGDGTLGHHNFDAGWVDPTDTLDYSRAHFEGRSRLWARAPFSAQNHYCTLASVLGIRESRFVDGPMTLTFEDFLEGRSHPDTVCDAYAHYDNHSLDYAEESDWARRHVVMCGQWRYMCEGEVPYRTLYPEGVDGVLIACRALSVDHDMHQLLRMQRDLQQIGEVCGLAAAESASTATVPAEIDVDDLREELGRRGILPDQPAEGPESSTVAEQLARLDSDQSGMAMWRLSRMSPDDEEWEKYFAEETGDGNRFRAAVAAALAGRDAGDVHDELLKAFGARAEEPDMGVRGPDAYVIALLALTELRGENVAERIGDALEEELDPPSVLLLLKALEQAGDPAGVEIIRRFLDRTDDCDFQHSMAGCPGDLTTSYRFAVVLRAIRTLKALGCDEEDGRLEAYVNSPHLLIRRHARRVAAGQ
jgi:NADPH-dependent 2,4-dienoyl-CoA reductase/sulfur reductase-like enzyme